MGAGVVRRNGSPPCHNDWSINALVGIGETSSQQVCPLQEVHVEAFARFCPYTRYMGKYKQSNLRIINISVGLAHFIYHCSFK